MLKRLQKFIYPNQIAKMSMIEVEEDSTFMKNLINEIKIPRRDESGKIISDHGLLNPIMVRPLSNYEKKDKFLFSKKEYAIIDGLHRLTAWKIVFGDNKPIPCYVVELEEFEEI